VAVCNQADYYLKKRTCKAYNVILLYYYTRARARERLWMGGFVRSGGDRSVSRSSSSLRGAFVYAPALEKVTLAGIVVSAFS
jgi:hypothetical protein